MSNPALQYILPSHGRWPPQPSSSSLSAPSEGTHGDLHPNPLFLQRTNLRPAERGGGRTAASTTSILFPSPFGVVTSSAEREREGEEDLRRSPLLPFPSLAINHGQNVIEPKEKEEEEGDDDRDQGGGKEGGRRGRIATPEYGRRTNVSTASSLPLVHIRVSHIRIRPSSSSSSFPSQTEKWRGRERRKIPLFSPHRMLIGRGRSPLLLLLLLFSLLHGTASGAQREEGGIGGSLFLLTSIPISTLLLLPPRQGRKREKSVLPLQVPDAEESDRLGRKMELALLPLLIPSPFPLLPFWSQTPGIRLC